MSSQFVWGYVVKHFDVNTQVETDISESVIGIPLFTDQGTSEVNNAKLILDASLGKFLVKDPLIHRYDNIRITAFSSNVGGGTYNHVYEVIRIIPSEGSTDGTRVELVLLGQEHNVQKINYSKTHYFEGSAEVIQDLGDGYNVNITGFQPTLSGHKTTDATNQVPGASFQTSIYAYGINEDQIYNRMQETVDKLGSSVDVGGALDFYEIKFDTDDTLYDKITINVFPSGENGDVILEDTENVNTGETEGGIDAEVATLINAWGAVDQGTLPIQHSQYKSKQQRFPLQPQWVDTETYGLGSFVQDEGIHYESLINNNLNLKPSLNLAFWDVVTRLDFYGNTIQYSPWTVDKDFLWRNAGSDRDSTGPFGEGCFDSNIVIFDNEDNYSATWVDIRETNPVLIDSSFLYGGTEIYRGFRILVDGTAEGILSTNQFGTGNGNDRNSKPYTNSITTYTGNEWQVLYEAVNDLECNVIDEGRPYTFNGTLWIQTPEQFLTFNTFYAFHPHDGITNQPGSSQETNTELNENSAIRARYDYIIPQSNILFPESFYKVGAWLNFRFPFPITTKGGISEGVGKLYGGANIVNGVPDAEREPATLDQQNMHLTHDGFRGFSNGESSEDYGQISSLDFWMKINAQIFVINEYRSSSEANFNMRCIIQDTSDNQVFQDFALNINNHWEPIHLPVNSFETYRARRPLNNPLQSFIPIKELEALNIFQWRNIKNIIIQTQDSYDNQGRYSPDPINNVNVGKFASLILAGGDTAAARRIELYIDAFRFTKPLLVNTGVPTDRVIERDFLQKPDINDYFQLQSDAFAELEKSTFPRVEYNIVTQGRFDINFGDSFWFRNPRLVPVEFESDDSPDFNNTNTIKLVAKKIEYSITNTEGGKGGFLRTITGVRRFV
jgi:hypothetical protein